MSHWRFADHDRHCTQYVVEVIIRTSMRSTSDEKNNNTPLEIKAVVDVSKNWRARRHGPSLSTSELRMKIRVARADSTAHIRQGRQYYSVLMTQVVKLITYGVNGSEMTPFLLFSSFFPPFLSFFSGNPEIQLNRSTVFIYILFSFISQLCNWILKWY